MNAEMDGWMDERADRQVDLKKYSKTVIFIGESDPSSQSDFLLTLPHSFVVLRVYISSICQ